MSSSELCCEMRPVDVEWWVVAPSVERWCRVMRCNAEWWCRVTSCNAVWWCRVVMPCGSEFSKVVVSTLQFTWLMKMWCTDRELPTVEDRCERCDLAPVQYSNRCVLGTVRASHKKGSVAGEASAERQKPNTDRDCRLFEDLTRWGLSGTFTHSRSHRVAVSCTLSFHFVHCFPKADSLSEP